MRTCLYKDFLREDRRVGEVSGQALVELAVLLPIILMILLGTLDLGRVYFASIATANAARVGSQFASTSPEAATDDTGVRNAVLAEMGDLADGASNPTVALTSVADAGGFIVATVEVAYTFRTIVPWPVIPSEIAMTRSVSSRVVQ